MAYLQGGFSHIFSHPDFTVGLGFAPSRRLSAFADLSWHAAGLWPGLTAGEEFHLALKFFFPFSISPALVFCQGLGGNFSVSLGEKGLPSREGQLGSPFGSETICCNISSKAFPCGEPGSRRVISLGTAIKPASRLLSQ